MACVGEGCHEQATLSTGASKVKTPLPSPTLSCAPTRLPTQRPFYPLPLSHAILLYSSTSFHSSPSSSLRRWSKSASLASCSSAPTSTLATTSCVTTSCASVPSSGATIITPAERSSTPSTVTCVLKLSFMRTRSSRMVTRCSHRWSRSMSAWHAAISPSTPCTSLAMTAASPSRAARDSTREQASPKRRDEMASTASDGSRLAQMSTVVRAPPPSAPCSSIVSLESLNGTCTARVPAACSRAMRASMHRCSAYRPLLMLSDSCSLARPA
mmetsp:Transcript_24227/g.78196  ORF Transcript_24227/g.78196 Transcript_24227/m.78196 type:complete len:270 (+) Transcript_24227:515-1324(+)